MWRFRVGKKNGRWHAQAYHGGQLRAAMPCRSWSTAMAVINELAASALPDTWTVGNPNPPRNPFLIDGGLR